MEDLISIVIPVYNVEKFLEKCVNSITNQTYKKLQIILVDDGSTDNSGAICDELAKKDSRIEVIHKSNGGEADARNEGLKRVKGNLLGFLDSDDIIQPTFYEELKRMMDSGDYDISECEFIRIPVDNIDQVQDLLEAENKLRNITEKEETREDALEDFYGLYLDPYVNKVVVWNKLYKMEIFAGITFPLGKVHEDEMIMYKVLSRVKKMITSNRVMYGYMQSSNSVMRRNVTQRHIEDYLDAYLDASKFFQNEDAIRANILRRYLENFIELYYKIDISTEDESTKTEKYKYIEERYLKEYEEYIGFVEQKTIRDDRYKIIDILKRAYEDIKMNKKDIGSLFVEIRKIQNIEL